MSRSGRPCVVRKRTCLGRARHGKSAQANPSGSAAADSAIVRRQAGLVPHSVAGGGSGGHRRQQAMAVCPTAGLDDRLARRGACAGLADGRDLDGRAAPRRRSTRPPRSIAASGSRSACRARSPWGPTNWKRRSARRWCATPKSASAASTWPNGSRCVSIAERCCRSRRPLAWRRWRCWSARGKSITRCRPPRPKGASQKIDARLGQEAGRENQGGRGKRSQRRRPHAQAVARRREDAGRKRQGRQREDARRAQRAGQAGREAPPGTGQQRRSETAAQPAQKPATRPGRKTRSRAQERRTGQGDQGAG